MNQQLKRLWYELNDRGGRLPMGLTLWQFTLVGLGLITLIVLQDMLVFVLTAYGMICLAIGLYCWFLELRFKRQSNQRKGQGKRWLL